MKINSNKVDDTFFQEKRHALFRLAKKGKEVKEEMRFFPKKEKERKERKEKARDLCF